jgi:hypothetical protein
MRRVLILEVVLASLALGTLTFVPGSPLCAQEVIDRIVARVENDVILLSDVRALGRYQQLVEGKTESDAQLLDRLIDQWIVRSEADTAQFPHPTEAEITAGVDRVQKSFTSVTEYESRKQQIGLTDADVKSMVTSAKVEPKDVDDFYQKAVVSRAQARGQAAPSLDDARDYIHEALIQRSIDEQADRWLSESRGRLRVEKFLEADAK